MTETKAPDGPKRRLWPQLGQLSRRRLILGLVLAPFATVFSLLGSELYLAFMVAPLPQSCSPLAQSMRPYFLSLSLVWLAIALGSPFSALILFVVKKTKPYAPFALLIWCISWSSLPLVRHFSFGRNWGLERITEKADPLIDAIESYNDTEGSYPPDLQALIPNYVNEIMYTGAVGYPDFEYERATPESHFKSYELYVRTPGGVFSLDTLIYWPEKHYPSEIHGNKVRLIEDWAYVVAD